MQLFFLVQQVTSKNKKQRGTCVWNLEEEVPVPSDEAAN